jgi:hypothetical protein
MEIWKVPVVSNNFRKNNDFCANISVVQSDFMGAN